MVIKGIDAMDAIELRELLRTAAERIGDLCMDVHIRIQWIENYVQTVGGYPSAQDQLWYRAAKRHHDAALVLYSTLTDAEEDRA